MVSFFFERKKATVAGDELHLERHYDKITENYR